MRIATACATVRVRLAAEAERAIADCRTVIRMLDLRTTDGTKRESAGDDIRRDIYV